MKKNFNSISELNNYINQQLKDALDTFGQKAWQHMYNHVQKYLIEHPENKGIYERTGQYLKSISRTTAEVINGKVVVKIYYDTDKIEPIVRTDGTLSAHIDDWGNDVSDFIPLWMEESVPYKTATGWRRHEAVGGIINLEEWAKKNFKNELKKELKKLGIQTK